MIASQTNLPSTLQFFSGLAILGLSLCTSCKSPPHEEPKSEEDTSLLRQFDKGSRIDCLQSQTLVIGGWASSDLGQIRFEAESHTTFFEMDLLSPIGNPVATLRLHSDDTNSSGSCSGQCPSLWTSLISRSTPMELRSLLCGIPGRVDGIFKEPSTWRKTPQNRLSWTGQSQIAGYSTEVEFSLQKGSCSIVVSEIQSNSSEPKAIDLEAIWDFGWFSQIELSAKWNACLVDNNLTMRTLEISAGQTNTQFDFEIFEQRTRP